MLHFKKYLSLNKLLRPYLIRGRELQNASPISLWDKKKTPGCYTFYLIYIYFSVLKGEEMLQKVDSHSQHNYCKYIRWLHRLA